LATRRSDEIVVLLGDILDFWIFSRFDKRGDLVNRVIAEWVELWEALKKLHESGTTLHYVPGNHDAFVFFVETAEHFPWSRAVMKRSEELQRIRNKTKDRRMAKLATIHYPFLELSIGSQKILFTHGHYSNWGWRQLAGIPEESRDSVLFLTTASIVLAHKHAGLLRRSVNELDWLRRVHGIEDIAISITNAIVQAYDGARQMLKDSPTDMAKVLDCAQSIYFGGKPAISWQEKLKIRDALLALSEIQGPHMPEDMQGIRDDTMKYLRQASREQNVHLDFSHQQQALAPRFTQFSAFVEPQEPDRLVFGHYHNPREADRAYDVGGFVDTSSTFFNIRKDGSIDRIN
jgi:UDP-2,3-diacylglucosamine pyrophosphatase LpxH